MTTETYGDPFLEGAFEMGTERDTLDGLKADGLERINEYRQMEGLPPLEELRKGTRATYGYHRCLLGVNLEDQETAYMASRSDFVLNQLEAAFESGYLPELTTGTIKPDAASVYA